MSPRKKLPFIWIKSLCFFQGLMFKGLRTWIFLLVHKRCWTKTILLGRKRDCPWRPNQNPLINISWAPNRGRYNIYHGTADRPKLNDKFPYYNSTGILIEFGPLELIHTLVIRSLWGVLGRTLLGIRQKGKNLLLCDIRNSWSSSPPHFNRIYLGGISPSTTQRVFYKYPELRIVIGGSQNST